MIHKFVVCMCGADLLVHNVVLVFDGGAGGAGCVSGGRGFGFCGGFFRCGGCFSRGGYFSRGG
jgi:hypothetical protein